MTSERGEHPRRDERLVRPYMVTGGRTRSHGKELPLETLVTTTRQGHAGVDTRLFEQRRILVSCREPLSIAEIASELEVPVGVARVLIGDLVAEGMLQPTTPTAKNEQLIRRLIDGVRSL
jgi:ribosomal protein S25